MNKISTIVYQENQEKLKLFSLVMISIIIGFMTSKISSIAILWGISLFFLGLYLILKTRNKQGIAHIFSAYMIGAEVFFRMSKSGLPWDFSKYTVILLLLLALIIDKRERKIPFIMFVFIILLLPGTIGTFEYYPDFLSIKKAVIFNLLGLFVLVVSTFYFYQMKFTQIEFIKLSRALVLGVLTMSTLVYFNVNDYTALEFTYSSNSNSSGGFSGNQVVTAFGLGILILGINLLLNNRLFIYRLVDIFFLTVFLFQAFIAFSRGGLFSAFLALLLGMLIFYFSNITSLIYFLKKSALKIILIIFMSIGIFTVVNNITDNKLYSRYFNLDDSGHQLKQDYTTGRTELIDGDLNLFIDSNFIGVGVGVSKLERSNHKNLPAHTEYSRLLAEHGILGFLIILILIFLPFITFLKRIKYPINNMILVSFSSLSLMTMMHSATRLGMVGFLFGLAFIFIVKERVEKR